VSDVLDEVTETEVMGALIASVRQLRGHQVISTEEAWVACTGRPVEEMGGEQEKRLRWLLSELGYLHVRVADLTRNYNDRTKTALMWTRRAWQNDYLFQDRGTFKAYVFAR
jgi:hypothetical protein